MFKIILTAILMITTLNASSWDSWGKAIDETVQYLKNKSNTKNIKDDIPQSKVNINSLLVKKYINEKNCDRILSNGQYFTTCYDYNYKSMIYGYSKIDGSLVNKGNLKDRPRFYEDKNIPTKYKTVYSDYTKTGFDRGHTQASDASYDFSQRAQLSTYTMSNITPQYPNTNRRSYLAVEKYERLIASKLGNVEVLTIVEFSNHPKRIGRNKLAVPSGYKKIYWNDKQNYQKCFSIPNDDIKYDLKEMEVSCKKILK